MNCCALASLSLSICSGVAAFGGGGCRFVPLTVGDCWVDFGARLVIGDRDRLGDFAGGRLGDFAGGVRTTFFFERCQGASEKTEADFGSPVDDEFGTLAPTGVVPVFCLFQSDPLFSRFSQSLRECSSYAATQASLFHL